MLNKSVATLPHIGPRRTFLLNKIGIYSIRDLLLFFPKKFLSKTNQVSAGPICLEVVAKSKHKNGKLWAIKCIDAENNIINLLFFSKKNLNMFILNNKYLVYGNAAFINNQWVMKHVKILSRTQNQFIPVYGTSVSNVFLHKLINQTITSLDNEYSEVFDIKKSIYNIHNNIQVQEAFEELKFLEATLFNSIFIETEHEEIKLDKSIIKNLPLSFELTNSQIKVLEEIIHNMQSAKVMRHMVFGEVGAGKTIVALISAILMIKAGYSVVFLVPTITLAQQHATWMLPFLEQIGMKGQLIKGAKKTKIEEDANLIISTHAILYGNYSKEIKNLGLVIVDEMQRFGVLQRAYLLANAVRKNLLMLSATPIPRSLNILLEKFITFSKIEQSVHLRNTETSLISAKQLEALIKKLILSEKKAYWVLPSIEENEYSIGVLERFKSLKNAEVDKVEFLHGKLKDDEKLEAINNFRLGKTKVLIATTIIEIGIDVPDADIMIIENAQRFGLAQLHQLRGRVGRKGQKAYCILIAKNTSSKKLQYFKANSDGFSISQYDLEARGAGRLLGMRQHGHDSNSLFIFLNIPEDQGLLDKAKTLGLTGKNIKAFELLIEQNEIIH